MSKTIYIRKRPAGHGVVVKPLHPGANNLGPMTKAQAVAYANTLNARLGFPIVDQSA